MKWPVLAAFLGLSLLGCSQGPREDDTVGVLPKAERPQTSATGTDVGQKLPDFQVPLSNGGTASLADYAGKHLIVYVTSYT